MISQITLLLFVIFVPFHKVSGQEITSWPDFLQAPLDPLSSEDLILCLPLNGNVRDHSGHKNHGKVIGAQPTTDRFGNQNEAFHFEGSHDRIEIPDHPELRLSQTDFTISLWMMEYDYNVHNAGALLVKRGLGRNNGWFFGSLGKRRNRQGNLHYTVSGGGDPLIMGSTNQLTLHTWHHVVLTYRLDKGEVSIYMDGKLQVTQTRIPFPNPHADATLFIGYDLPTQKYGVNGKIDEVLIFRRALEMKEIQVFFQKSSEEKVENWLDWD